MLFILNRPIFDLCMVAERLCGSSRHQFWWEQPMDLDAARGAGNATPEEASDDEDKLVERLDGLGVT